METKTCKHCDTSFDITDKDLEFYEKVSPVFDGQRPVSNETGLKDMGNGKIKYLIPTPTFCPDCRHQRRLLWRNEKKLYRRKCNATGKEILSIISPDKPYKVYEQKIWHGDNWDGKDYGRDFNFERGFFEQFNELLIDVPQIDRYLIDCDSSDYCHGVGHLKKCYLCFNTDNLEDCMYCITSNDSKKSVDCSFVKQSNFCYDSFNLFNCYNLLYSFDSEDSSDSYFVSSCFSCQNCFFCTNLVNKKYCIYNKEFTKEEYEKQIKEILENNSIEKLKKEFKEYSLKFPKKYRFSKNIENSTGNYIENVKDSNFVFDCDNIEDCKYSWYVFNAKNCMDYDIYGDNSELIYEAIISGSDLYKSCFTAGNWSGGSYMLYSTFNFGCKNCFGCNGLKNQEYCIFNKQYTKEEYEKLVPKIIEHMKKTGEWGEYFPKSICLFGYNETLAQEYFPLKKEEAVNSGYKWSDYEAPFPKVEKVIPASKLPDKIEDIPEDILNWAIECEITKKPFRIIKQELDFYRKHNLPIPKKHPDQRYLERLSQRNPRRFYDRKCDKCKKNIKTTYYSERPEIVYCQKCYDSEIY